MYPVANAALQPAHEIYPKKTYGTKNEESLDLCDRCDVIRLLSRPFPDARTWRARCDDYCILGAATADPLHARYPHGTVADGQDHDQRKYAARHSTANEVFDLQVPLAGWVFLHNGSYATSIQVVRWVARGDLLILGKPLVGSAMAALHISTPAMTRRLGCGSSNRLPTS